eukprot:1337023-Amorphochlora_amoeboformis.AAC.1
MCDATRNHGTSRDSADIIHNPMDRGAVVLLLASLAMATRAPPATSEPSVSRMGFMDSEDQGSWISGVAESLVGVAASFGLDKDALAAKFVEYIDSAKEKARDDPISAATAVTDALSSLKNLKNIRANPSAEPTDSNPSVTSRHRKKKPSRTEDYGPTSMPSKTKRSTCCIECTYGKPCGDVCIPLDAKCEIWGGCACEASIK